MVKAGCGRIGPVSATDDRPASEMLEIAVVPPHRGQGVERALRVLWALSVAVLSGPVPPVMEVVIRRRGTGDIVARQRMMPEGGQRDWLVQRMRAALVTSTEARFLEVWGDPRGWRLAAGLERS